MKYDMTLLVLYFITLLLVILELSGIWSLAIILLLVMIITLVQKINIEDHLNAQKQDKERKFSRISDSVALIGKNVEDIRYNLDKNTFVVEGRINVLKHEYESALETQFSGMARKIQDLENSLNSTRKTLAAVFGTLDDRLQNIEDREKAAN